MRVTCAEEGLTPYVSQIPSLLAEPHHVQRVQSGRRHLRVLLLVPLAQGGFAKLTVEGPQLPVTKVSHSTLKRFLAYPAILPSPPLSFQAVQPWQK